MCKRCKKGSPKSRGYTKALSQLCPINHKHAFRSRSLKLASWETVSLKKIDTTRLHEFAASTSKAAGFSQFRRHLTPNLCFVFNSRPAVRDSRNLSSIYPDFISHKKPGRKKFWYFVFNKFDASSDTFRP